MLDEEHELVTVGYRSGRFAFSTERGTSSIGIDGAG
jgi:hypothetical protein